MQNESDNIKELVPLEVQWMLLQRETEAVTDEEVVEDELEESSSVDDALEEKVVANVSSADLETVDPFLLYKQTAVVAEAEYEEQQYDTTEKQEECVTEVFSEESVERIVHNEIQEDAGNFHETKFVHPREKKKYELLKLVNPQYVHELRFDIWMGIKRLT